MSEKTKVTRLRGTEAILRIKARETKLGRPVWLSGILPLAGGPRRPLAFGRQSGAGHMAVLAC